MAGTSTPALAAAVSNAGGLGSIAVGAMDAEATRKAIRSVKQLTDKPFNVNVFTHTAPQVDPARESAWMDLLRPHFAPSGVDFKAPLQVIYKTLDDDPAKVDVIVEEAVPVVSFHFGLPSANIISRLKRSAEVLLASVTNLDEAKAAEAAGMDILVAQGYEAGGHRGMFDPQAKDEELDTIILTRILSSSTSLPIVAAGGIMDGQGIAKALASGASAVQLGTAFLLCPETALDAGHRQSIENTNSTYMTTFVSGRAARSLASKFTQLELDNPHVSPPDYPLTYHAGKALHAAAKSNGDSGYGAYWAGSGVAACREMPAGQLVQVLMEETAKARA